VLPPQLMRNRVFVAASGVALIGFALFWLLPERPLRETAASSLGLGDGLAAPRSPDSLAEVERALTLAVGTEQRERFRERLARRAGVDLSGAATWALVRISERGLARARSRLTVPPGGRGPCLRAGAGRGSRRPERYMPHSAIGRGHLWVRPRP
jgi:hypothetical protein